MGFSLDWGLATDYLHRASGSGTVAPGICRAIDLRNRIDAKAKELRAGMAHREGLLEGLRETTTGKRVA